MRTLLEILQKSDHFDGVNKTEAQDYYTETATRAAVKSLLWSETDENGEPFDRNWYANQIDREDVTRLRAFVRDFISTEYEGDESNSPWSIILRQEIDPEQFGHDFILTANGHGAGYWDRGYKDDGETLTRLCKPFGTFDLYEGDDGVLYISGV